MAENIIQATDGYKLDHRRQYPEGTTLVYGNWTPRGSRMEGVNEVVFFGLQYFMIKYLRDEFNVNFFNQDQKEILEDYQSMINSYLGPNQIGTDHIKALHDLGYMPIEIKALPEGTLVPLRVPMFTIQNTKPEFFWLVNYLETLISTTLWMPCTSATIALQYRKVLDHYCKVTGGDKDFVQFQGHDFSMRGMPGLEAAMMSGAGHLLSFRGSDTIPAVNFLERYYMADAENELVGVGVAATEHSVMCMGSIEGEFKTFKRLITEVYPSGIISIVSDTWDLWKVITDYIPRLKKEIMARDGKIVIRPDSGDPQEIICGRTAVFTTKEGMPDVKERAAELGVIRSLWETFGGTETPEGYKVLDPHIGVIYGDAITLDRCTNISKVLMDMGFASTNMVFGIGSYTYQYNTRDTFGFAMKSTYGEVDGEGREIFKDPITDDGLKKSARGLIMIQQNAVGDPEMIDQVSRNDEEQGMLQTVFKDGDLVNPISLAEVRSNLHGK